MLAIIIAMATSALPQTATPQTTTPQGNGHHASDERRRASDRQNKASAKQREKQDRGTDGQAPAPSSPPSEKREPDGTLMPGAPGTNNPTIPDGGSSGG